MKPIKLLSLAAACLLIFTVTSCKKTTSTNNCSTSGTFSCTLDGGSFSGNTYNNTLLKLTSGGVDAKRLDIRATGSNGKQVILSISDYRDGKTGDGFRTGTYYFDAAMNPCNGSGTACIGALFSIIESGSNFVSTPVDPYSTGSVVITSCDEANHKISGTFSGSFQSLGGGSTHTATSGTFTDLCYSVISQ